MVTSWEEGMEDAMIVATQGQLSPVLNRRE